MSGALNLLPARVAIGTTRDGVPVYVTPEFSRALADVFARVGGVTGSSTEDLAVELATSSLAAVVCSLARLAADLELQAAQLAAQFAAVGQLRKALASRELDALPTSTPTDWEHPGKVGASTPNSGKFTTLDAAGKVTLNPKDVIVEIKPTGTALLTIKPAAVGQLDNMEIGKTAPAPARVTTLNKMTFTQPATAATWTLADGKTFSVATTMTLTGNDGATLNIGGGGTLGSAAYADGATFASRSNTALAGVATDAATTQALANSLRAVLLSVGIGS